MSLNKTGLPKCLSREFKKLVMSKDTTNVRLVLTILSLSRGILGGTPVDTLAITAASKAVISRELIDHVYDALEYLKISPGTVPEANSFH